MWKPLQKSPPHFITFFKESDDLYYVGVTDYKQYWLSNVSRKSFLADLKKSNDGLEFDDENELVQRGLDMLSNPETLKRVSVLQGDLGKLLSISITQIYEVPLKLELDLLEASTEHFFSKVIQPLLKTVCDLRSSQNELRELLLKKDREIEEYKIEGKAPRRLITTVYDDAAHMLKHTAYEEYFGASDVSELLEVTAQAGNNKPKKPAMKSRTPAVKPLNKDPNTTTTLKTDREKQDKTASNSIKVEKNSQNTPIDETATSIIPTQIEESVKPEFLAKTIVKHKSDVKTEPKNALQRKRPKTQLNY